MADRDTIQQRIDALAALERARELRDQGDYNGARAALRACLGVLPDHDEALALRMELGDPADDAARDTFQVSDWIAEEKARSSGEPTSQDDLRRLLREAIAEGEHEQIVSLGEALLSLTGPDTMLYHEQVAISAETLVERNDPEQLDVALGWADTWWRVCQDPRAKDYARSLKSRIATVGHREQQVRDALTRGSLSELMTAVHELTSSRDRLGSTGELLAAAETRLVDLRADISSTREAVEAAIPDRINAARRLLEELVAVEPDPATEARLEEMRDRERAVAEIHRLLEEALDREHYTPLLTQVERLRASRDKLSTSLQLLERATPVLERLRAEREANLQAYQRGLSSDLEQAVVALTALRRVDPDHELCANLTKLERRLRELEQQHMDLERRLSDKDLRGVDDALRRVRARTEKLSITPKLVTRAERYLEDAHRRERHHRNLVLSITAGSLIALAIPLGLWLVERHRWHRALEVEDPEQRLAAVGDFADGWTLFYAQSATRERQLLVAELEDAAWQRALATPDPEERIAAIEGFLERYQGSGRSDEAPAAIAAAERELDGAAFEAARAHADPLERIAALEAFRERARGEGFATLATQAIEHARQEDDERRWRTAAAPGEDLRQRLETYLAVDGPQVHAAEARAMIAELERSSALDDVAAADNAAWARVAAAQGPEARLSAIDAYLADNGNTRHRAAAVAARREARVAADEEAWRTASATAGDPAARLERLASYLERTNPPPAHALEARSLMAEIQREQERSAWMRASAPGTTADRIRRLRDYRERYPESTYRSEAGVLLRQLEDEIDYAAYARAKAALAPGQRVLALQDYLAGNTSRANAERAQAEIRRSLAEIEAFPLEDIALESEAVLVQLDPQVLARLPQPVQLRLPATTLRRLPARAQAALPLSAFAALGPAELRTVPRSPVWCIRSGVDATGSWAEIDLRGRATLRLRLLPPAEGPAGRLPALWVGESEVTQAQWRAIAGSHPSEQEGPDLPVHRLRADETQRFIERLADHLDLDGTDGAPRLPAAAELRLWVATAASGPAGAFPATTVPDAGTVARLARVATTSDGTIGPATGREADGWGLHGTLGNVAEWCRDGDTFRVLGGHYASRLDAVVPAPELAVTPDARDPRVGMRIVIPAR